MPLRALGAVALVLPLAAGAFCTQPADKYSVLARRVATAASNEAEVQCIILDAMVPNHSDECIICMEEPRQTVLMPCGHMLACATCAAQLDDCPTCRKRITSRVRVYT